MEALRGKLNKKLLKFRLGGKKMKKFICIAKLSHNTVHVEQDLFYN